MGKVSKRMGIIERETPPCLLNKTLGLVRNCSLEVEMIGEKNENLFFSHLWLKKRFLLGFLYLIWSSLSWLLQDLSFLSHVEYIYAEHKCFSSWQLLERRKTEFSVLCAFFFVSLKAGLKNPRNPSSAVPPPHSGLNSSFSLVARPLPFLWWQTCFSVFCFPSQLEIWSVVGFDVCLWCWKRKSEMWILTNVSIFNWDNSIWNWICNWDWILWFAKTIHTSIQQTHAHTVYQLLVWAIS